jgi:hypothetical protein
VASSREEAHAGTDTRCPRLRRFDMVLFLIAATAIFVAYLAISSR